jgi:hypothetical protein
LSILLSAGLWTYGFSYVGLFSTSLIFALVLFSFSSLWVYFSIIFLGFFFKNNHLFLTVLKAESLRRGCQHDWGFGEDFLSGSQTHRQ